MKYAVSDEERRLAKHSHEIFLINLITNHILVFVGLLGMAKSYPYLLLVVPAFSVATLAYILVRARKARNHESWFVMCHWQLGAARARLFIIMLGIMAAVILLVLAISGGNPGPQHYALGGVGVLPTMLTVLVLIIMESDALHQANSGIVPKSMVERFPNPEMQPVEA